MTRLETTVTVDDDGMSANVAFPVPVAPGRHRAIVIIDDETRSDDPIAWVERTYGSVTDDIFEHEDWLI